MISPVSVWHYPNKIGSILPREFGCTVFRFARILFLKLTASLPLKIGRNPRGKDRLPISNFEGLWMLVSGRVNQKKESSINAWFSIPFFQTTNRNHDVLFGRDAHENKILSSAKNLTRNHWWLSVKWTFKSQKLGPKPQHQWITSRYSFSSFHFDVCFFQAILR